ncbi:MAG: phosphatidylglycerophosphatase A [Burkholderiales bacterium]|nr:phosphatidylglycerophosphatase A [Burkholderiales bacterium]
MSTVAGARPTAAFLVAHPAHFLALGFGTGLAPFGPGTVGTLLAIPLHAALGRWLSPLGILALLPAFFALGVWACGRTGRDLGAADHSGMNWDEIVAYLLVLVFTPPGLAWQVFAFVAFRCFDILKPPPIRHFDRTLKGGFGVMLDDLVAAFYTLLLIAVAKAALA